MATPPPPESILHPTEAGPLNLHVCRDGDGHDDGWVELYTEAFPPDQRQDLDDLRAQLLVGSMELDETRDDTGRLVCMSVTEVFTGTGPDFLLACYTATRPDLRSQGIGSVHRRKLAELLQGEYPRALGLFSEIESTREPGLDAATRTLRERRLAFFLRLGVQRIDLDYLFPSFTPGTAPLHGELLWLPFGSAALDRDLLRSVLTRIYTEGYGVPTGDPFLTRALATAGV